MNTLSSKHRAILELVADPSDTRTQQEKCAEVGISPVTLWRLLKKQTAVDYLNKRMYELLPTAKPEAYQCFVRELRKGNVYAARNLLQSTGDINTGGHTTNVSVTQTQAANDEEYFERVELLNRARRIQVTEDTE